MNILIVDDSADIVRLVSQVLNIEGHTVQIARDGREALQKIASQTPDAVILDVNMPGIEGWEVCHHVKQNHPHVPVMMLTVRAEKTDREKGKKLGADAYLAKPFDIPEFLVTLKEMLKKAYRPERFKQRYSDKAVFVNANGSHVWEALGRNATNNPNMSIARITMAPDVLQQRRRNSFSEVLIVIEGRCTVEFDEYTYTLEENDVLQIPAGTFYREQGQGAEPCVAWAICTPAYSLKLVEYEVAEQTKRVE